MEFDRLYKILTEEEKDKIAKQNICIVGIGGVGGNALEALVRTGINRITIIDPDIVDVTNINRQIIALHSTIGMSKVEVAKQRMLDINPDIQIHSTQDTVTLENMDDYITEEYTYIIDACDMVTTKLGLIRMAFQKQIPIISSMGTGNKFDPSKLQITKLSKTSNDPLAKVMRHELKKDHLDTKLTVVASTELGRKTKDRTPGSTALVPPVAGVLIAAHIINEVIKK